ncbi:hypothetical protein BVC71_04910 [Marivivens niveibacter]|uniref:Uncharacterized protein n=1 Tax=Marivivens niveibacter TaxID=1930667 RepID=A0A251X2I9_9RHOB|nr:hypothetical protein BVC71_04910 [Marivivens niveibacter]
MTAPFGHLPPSLGSTYVSEGIFWKKGKMTEICHLGKWATTNGYIFSLCRYRFPCTAFVVKIRLFAEKSNDYLDFSLHCNIPEL